MFDFLIVGGGVGGISLAMHLLQKQQTLQVIDQPNLNISSSVAAGIFNPVASRLVKNTYLANKVFPYLHNYYRDLEKLFYKKILVSKNIYKPFLNTLEYDSAISNIQKTKYVSLSLKSISGIDMDFGFLKISNGGYINVNTYLDAARFYLKQRSSYLHHKFDYENLKIKENYIEYNNIFAKKIIFCEGPQVINNPFFKDLPFKLVKGQILHLSSELTFKHIINRGVFLFSPAPNKVILGATYDRDIIDLNPTFEGRAMLVGKANKLMQMKNYKIDNQKVGIRPATLDRRPIIGMHPIHNNLGIFNGFGSKGISLTPYLANMFSKYLVEGKDILPKETSIDRYIKFL